MNQSESALSPVRSEAIIDLAAIRHNVATLRSKTSAQMMAVVKADGYGHGMVPTARAALSAGAQWLGVAFLEEALTLRQAGIIAPILCWLYSPGESLEQAVQFDIDLSVSAPWAVQHIASAARSVGRQARIHLKVDTGLSRGGAPVEGWADVVTAAAKAQAAAEVEVIGIWSHLVAAEEPENPINARQLTAFRDALTTAIELGVEPQIRHLANSAGLLGQPDTHFDLVRPGIAMYGLKPGLDIDMSDFVPAMTLKSHVALTKRVPAGAGISYGHQRITEIDTGLALVPLGYADGIPRAASNCGEVLLAGKRRQIAGRVAMDQFVVETNDDSIHAGDEIVLFGPGANGEPTADDWATVTNTIGYEIVTRIGNRVPRRYVGGEL